MAQLLNLNDHVRANLAGDVHAAAEHITIADAVVLGGTFSDAQVVNLVFNVEAVQGGGLLRRVVGDGRDHAGTARVTADVPVGGLVGACGTADGASPAGAFRFASDEDVVRPLNDPAVTRDAAGLYLMAGGDTLLGAGASNPKQIVGRAGLTTLAELTVKALLQGEKPTAALPVYLDGTFFSGPGVNPGWDAADVASGQITPIHPIALESHTVPGKSTASNPVRPDDAAVAAQQAFVDALNTAGKESGMSFTLAERRTAPAEAVEIAAVESATLLEQAQHMMLESDNALAEVLGRCAAIAAGKEGSGEAAQQTVRQALVNAGVNIENLVQADVCGMSLTDRVTTRTLVQVVALLNADEHAEQLMSTFPVAGVSGTLSGRFGAANAVHARTFVQAKTGTLYTVSSLCGVATRPDGTRLIFAIILNDLGGADALPAAKERVDAAAAAIANRSTAPSASVPASEAPAAAVSTATVAGTAS